MNPGNVVSAGSIVAELGPGLQLRNIRLEGHPALDAIYYAVRDEAWNTIAENIEEQAFQETMDGFHYAVVLRHTDAEIDVRTTATITGTAHTVEFSFAAEALKPQKVNRVGLCVLHPLELTEHEVMLQTDEGASMNAFSLNISPHQSFLRLRGMTEAVAADLELTIDFDGGLFETEDHRNWTDAGWKTYSPPLDEPRPIQLETGEVLRQRIVLTPRVGSSAQARLILPAHLAIGDGPSGRLPRIGFGASGTASAELSDAGAGRSLSPEFLIVELVGGWESIGRFELALAEARMLKTRLSVLLACSYDDISEWGRRLREHGDEIASVSVVDPHSHVSSQAMVDRMRYFVGADSIRIGAGTRGYFAQINRSISDLGSADYLCFSVSPEVHHFDDERIFDTLRAQRMVVEDAQRLAPDSPLMVGPITLRQRLNLEGESGDYAPYSDRVLADPRMGEQFAAAWVVGAISGLAKAESLAFFTVQGAGGVVDAGALTPAGSVFEALAGYRGAALIDCVVSDPRFFGALAVRGLDGRQMVLVANYRADELAVTVDYQGRAHPLVLGPYEVRSL